MEIQIFPLVLVALSFGVLFEDVSGTFYNVGVSYEVSLDVYSGRRDPKWTVTSKHPLYQQIASAVNQRPPTNLKFGLGYCGFVIRAKNVLGQTAWKTVGRQTNRALESMLLDSCPSGQRRSGGGASLGFSGDDDDVSPNVMNHVRSGIYGQFQTVTIVDNEEDMTIQTVIRRGKRQAVGSCSTRFEPDRWNYSPVQRRNNCYNYASNIQTNTFAQPGRGSGQRYTQTEANNVYQACLRDGFQPLSGPTAGNGCLMALVIWPGEDYHFYRRDSSGYWSHKSGQTRARNVDESGNRITDPRTCDRGPYRIFAGWLRPTPTVTIN